MKIFSPKTVNNQFKGLKPFGLKITKIDIQFGGKCYQETIEQNSAVVLVRWSAHMPSTPKILARIMLTFIMILLIYCTICWGWSPKNIKLKFVIRVFVNWTATTALKACKLLTTWIHSRQYLYYIELRWIFQYKPFF